MINHIENFPGREITVQEQKYLYFGGTSYLGLQTDTEFQSVFIHNIQKYGTSYGASRLSNVRISIFEKGESYLANLVGSEACITMSSGFLAGQLLVQHFSDAKHAFFYAPNTHSALHLPHTKNYASYDEMNLAVRSHLDHKKDGFPVVLIDSIDFSGRNYPNFDGLLTLPLEKIILLVDDSHGIGIIGAEGGGVFRQLENFGAKELIICCSLAKGLGIQAGVVFGTRGRIDRLANSDIFGSASPAAPAAVATLTDTPKIISAKRKLLRKHISLFLSQLVHRDTFMIMKEHPVFSFTDPGLVDYLECKNIVVTDFKYPMDNGDTMSRIVLSAHHYRSDVLTLSIRINNYPKDKTDYD